MLRRIGLIIMIMAFIFGCQFTYAADADDTLGAAVKGQQHCSLSIADASLSYEDPGTVVGAFTTELTGSPVDVEIMDNYLNVPTGEVTLLGVKVLEPLPSQFGPTYNIWMGGELTFFPDNQCNQYNVIGAGEPLVNGDEAVVIRCFGGCGGNLVHVKIAQTVRIHVKANKRLYGDTSDAIVLQYTLYDY